jgi:hypothetical protein
MLKAAKTAVAQPHLAAYRVWYNTRRTVSDMLYPFGYCNYPHRIMFLAGMAMGATTWIKNLFARVPGLYTRSTPMPDPIRDNQDICDSAFSRIPRYGNTLFKTHLNPTQENVDCIFRNGVEKVIISHRDLRDVAISRYYRLIDLSKPKSDPNALDYVALGKEKAIDHSIDIIKRYYEPWILGWVDLADRYPGRFLFVKFEDLKADVEAQFRTMLDFYGISLKDDTILRIIEEAKGKSAVKTNIKKGKVLPFAIASNFRRGETGYWKNELTDAQLEKCRSILGPSLIKLGYESDFNWSRSSQTIIESHAPNPV